MESIQNEACSSSDRTFKPVLWNNMIDEYRFVIQEKKLVNQLTKECYGYQTIADYNIFVNDIIVVSAGEPVCFLHPYEILYLTTHGKFLNIVDQENDMKYLSSDEIASRLCDFSSFIPSVYLRFRNWRDRYVCKMQSSFNGVHFGLLFLSVNAHNFRNLSAVYPGNPNKVHSSLLVCHKTGSQEIQAASRVFSSIKKQGLLIKSEVPSIDLKNPNWFRDKYTFNDVMFEAYKDN